MPVQALVWVPRTSGRRWLWVVILVFAPQRMLLEWEAGDGEAISVVWVFVFVTRPGVGFSVAVSLKPFKTQLKVELLFLEGIERMPLEGLEVQE